MDDEKYSKKDLKALRKLQELEKTTAEKNQNTIKWIVISIITFIVLSSISYDWLKTFAHFFHEQGETL
jgi:uncharacterized Rmd1/YagE family protein